MISQLPAPDRLTEIPLRPVGESQDLAHGSPSLVVAFVGVVGTQLALLSGLWTHEEDDPDPARWLCGPAVAGQGVLVVGVGLMAAGG